MCRALLKALGHFMGAVGGISLVMGGYIAIS